MNQTFPSLAKNPSEFVTLRNGLTLPASAIRLACVLEHRGWKLSTRDDRLILTPTPVDGVLDTLSETDTELVKKLKNHLMAIALLAANEA